MKKRLVLFIIIITYVTQNLQAQAEVGIFAGNTTLGKDNFFQVGTQMYVPLPNSRFTLDYTFSIGSTGTGGLYLHCPASIIGAGYVASTSYLSKASLESALFMLIIPEGVGYYLDDAHNAHISVKALAVDYYYRSGPYTEFMNLGINATYNARFKTYLKFPAYLSPFVGVSYYYRAPTNVRTSVNFGLSFEFQASDPHGTTQDFYDPFFEHL